MIQRLFHGGCAVAFLVLTGSVHVACGGGDDPAPDARVHDAQGPAPDAPDARPACYGGGGTPTPGAEVEVGAHRSGIGYAPLNENDELLLYAGLQGGYHFFPHARIRGISPGSRLQPPELNPATQFTAHLEDGTDVTQQPCTAPLAYQEADNGDYVLPYAPILQIDSRVVPAIYSQRVRIKVEVMDSEGRYATDEQWVIPVAAVPDAGVPDAGPDAGPDAAVEAATIPGT